MEVISVTATIPGNFSRRLLQASNNTIVAVLSVASTAANTNDFNPQTAAAAIPVADLQAALTAQLQVLNVAPSRTRLLELAILLQFTYVSRSTPSRSHALTGNCWPVCLGGHRAANHLVNCARCSSTRCAAQRGPEHSSFYSQGGFFFIHASSSDFVFVPLRSASFLSAAFSCLFR